MQDEPNIKIFMCCHNKYEIVPPLCVPIQCGRILNTPIAGIVGDDNGNDNISVLNREYCELTAHYYAWKNEDLTHYGFCHYRRFFSLDEKIKYPYIAKDSLSDTERVRLLGDTHRLKRLIQQYDIIVPRCEDMGLSVWEHYCSSDHHYKEDLELFLEVLREQHPVLDKYAKEYLMQNKQYFCNMFIMEKELFFEYCRILFPVLDQFDKRKSLHGDFQSDRTDGYLGELFTGIFINYCRSKGTEIKELPRVDVYCKTAKRLGCLLLPPESRRRFIMKRLYKKMKGR